jgi:hypothetical protein
VQTLNRLSGRPLEAPLPTTTRVRDLGLPELSDAEAAMKDALARSPELARAAGRCWLRPSSRSRWRAVSACPTSP